jgi:hypothetical protein
VRKAEKRPMGRAGQGRSVGTQEFAADENYES